MRVLFATSQADLPEIELCVGLKAAGVEIDWLGSKKSLHQERLLAAGVCCQHLELRGRVDLSGINALRKVLNKGHYDLVHAFTARALSNLLFLSLFRSHKLVTYRGTMGHLSRWDPAARWSYLHSRVDATVCVSDAVRSYLLNLQIPQSKLTTIYKGHNPSWYDEQVAPALAAFGVPQRAFVIGCVASMRPVKGIDTLLEAAILLENCPSMHFLLVGEVRDPLITKLAKDSRIRDRIHFTGARPDAIGLIRQCNVAVMASKEREGLPKAVIEAMCMRVPVVVTRVGGMPELVVEGESGKIVPPSDPKALSEALRDLFRNQEKSRLMGARARERIESKFSIKRTIDQHLALYRFLISR